jgi:Fe-S cluster assembly protein SufD
LGVPVQILNLGASASAAHLRHVVILGEGASATLIESYFGGAGAWTNAVSDIALAAKASLTHVTWQGEGSEAFHTGVSRARLLAGASYSSFVLQTGARLARREIDVIMAGEGATCRLHGVSLGRDKQHMDNTTVIEHAAAGCSSDEHYRGVFDDEAKGVFQGAIVVKPHAQKTDAHQLNENLLLSERAEAHSKPELEIHADDVKCGHGATAGELDEQALFYLRARGIGREAARAMLIEAFVAELVDGVGHEDAKVLLSEAVSQWLGAVGAVARAA